MARRKSAFKNVSACNRYVRGMLDKASARQRKHRGSKMRIGKSGKGSKSMGTHEKY